MSEWTIVTVLIAIIGLIATVTAPLLKNTKAMTKLSDSIEHLSYRVTQEEKELSDFKEKSSKNHKRIYEKLDNHEDRIDNLEHKTKNIKE